MVPGRMRWLAMLCSNSSAKLSVMFSLKLFPSTYPCARGVTKNNGHRSMKAATKFLQNFTRQTSAGHFQDALDHRIDGHPRCIHHTPAAPCPDSPTPPLRIPHL